MPLCTTARAASTLTRAHTEGDEPLAAAGGRGANRVGGQRCRCGGARWSAGSARAQSRIQVAVLPITASDQPLRRQPSSPSPPARIPDRRSPGVARRGPAWGTAVVADISVASRTNCETLKPWRLGGFRIQLHPVAGEADRGAGHGHGEELAKRSSPDCPLAPMLALARARMLAERRPPLVQGTPAPPAQWGAAGRRSTKPERG